MRIGKNFTKNKEFYKIIFISSLGFSTKYSKNILDFCIYFRLNPRGDSI